MLLQIHNLLCNVEEKVFAPLHSCLYGSTLSLFVIKASYVRFCSCAEKYVKLPQNRPQNVILVHCQLDAHPLALSHSG